MHFRELDMVRVVKLLAKERHVMGSFASPPQPAVGDEGIVVNISSGHYMVECVDREGYTRWLADFAPEELEPFAPAQ